MPKIQHKNTVIEHTCCLPSSSLNRHTTFSQEERLRDRPTYTNFCLQSLVFPYFTLANNVIIDTELTEKAPSADSAAALSNLENKMTNFTVSNKAKPLKS